MKILMAYAIAAKVVQWDPVAENGQELVKGWACCGIAEQLLLRRLAEFLVDDT
jgi:hypothetical protein